MSTTCSIQSKGLGLLRKVTGETESFRGHKLRVGLPGQLNDSFRGEPNPMPCHPEIGGGPRRVIHMEGWWGLIATGVVEGLGAWGSDP